MEIGVGRPYLRNAVLLHERRGVQIVHQVPGQARVLECQLIQHRCMALRFNQQTGAG